MKKAHLFFIMIFIVTNTRAQDSSEVSMITNRPGFTEASRAVYKTGFQIEAGFQYSKDPLSKGSGSSYTNLLIPNLGLLYGISKNVELRVFGNMEAYKFNYGNNSSTYNYQFDGLIIGTKVNLTEGKKALPEMALLITQGIPTNAELIDIWTTSALLAWSYSLPSNFGLSGNLAYSYESEFEDDYTISNPNQFNYTLNLGYSIKENLGTYIEMYGGKNIGSSDDFDTRMSGGFYYRVTPKFQLDAIGGYGFNNGSYLGNVGCSWLLMK